jgi:Tol biopolymer transport system component
MSSRSRRASGWAVGLVGSVLGAAIVAAACGDSSGTSVFDDQTGKDGSITPIFDSGVFGDGPTDAPNGTLSILPADSVIDVPPTATVQFQAFEKGNATPVAATWSIDSPAIGSIDATGLFTPRGDVGGVLTVFAERGGRTATTTLTVRAHVSDIPPGFDPGILDALKNGGTADANFKWLYPYDRTVFPRGILAPTLQWSGTKPVWLYVKVTTAFLDYVGVYAPTNSNQIAGAPPQLDLPPKVWNAVTLSAGSKDPAKIEVTKYVAAGQVTGPIKEQWTIAQGSLKGIVYYNSYDSPLAAGDAGAAPGSNDMGAIMRIKPGAKAPEVLLGGAANGSCTVCHTVSANGSTMALSAGHKYDAVYNLAADGGAPTGPVTQGVDNAYSFGALTPDGKYLLSCGSTGLDAGSDGGPLGLDDFGPNVVSMTREQTSQLIDTADGGVVVSLLPGVPKALMPAFSPDGTKLVFNRFVDGQDQRLSVMPFDEKSHVFGAYSDVFVDPGFFLSWPSFLPDSKSFVFQTSDDSDQYSSFTPGYADANGELFVYFDVNKDVHHLRGAMGTIEGTTPLMYLLNPDGTPADQDTRKNYEPTALPVASGGYYWVVFTSRRSYGNTIDNSDPSSTPDTVKPKKLWVTAVDIDAPGDADPSHPAFYLPGQELAAGNLRGFWALEPCKQDGNSCASGSDCCGGFCRSVAADGGSSFVCIPPPTSCANEDEKCTTTTDCCGAPANGIRCINGFCARPTPR